MLSATGKDSKTLMLVQVSPSTVNVSETICSLQFAQRTRTVELGPPSRKEVNTPSKKELSNQPKKEPSAPSKKEASTPSKKDVSVSSKKEVNTPSKKNK